MCRGCYQGATSEMINTICIEHEFEVGDEIAKGECYIGDGKLLIVCYHSSKTHKVIINREDYAGVVTTLKDVQNAIELAVLHGLNYFKETAKIRDELK